MPPFIAIPITMPDSTSTAPTERSIPPLTMTAVMPIAMMATKAKLRVTLNRFCWVAKTSLASARTTNAATAATETQNTCWLASRASQCPCTRPAIVSSSEGAAIRRSRSRR